MADHGATLTDLPAEGERVDVSMFSKITNGAGIVGLLTLLVSVGIIFFGGKDSEFRDAFSYSWLFACYFFFTIAAGGLFWVLLHNVSNSGWGVAIRRVMEHLSNMLPYVFVLFIPILIIIVLVAFAMWLSASLSKTVSPTIIIVVQKIFGILLGALAIEFVVAGVIESFKL